MTTRRMLLNRLLLAAVLLALAIWTVLQLLGIGARGEFELWGIGRAAGAIELLVIAFLFLNAGLLRVASGSTLVVLLWVPWVLLSVTFSVGGDLSDWVAAGAIPVLLWPLTYLFFYAQMRMDPGKVFAMSRYFFAISAVCAALFFAVFDTLNAGRTAGFQQVNGVYYPLLTLPWVAIARRPRWRAVGALMIVLAVSFSLKRTAFVALAMAGVAYVLVELSARTRSSRLRVALPLAALLALAGTAYLRVDEWLDDAFTERLLASRADAGSDRLSIYKDVIEAVQGAPFENLILGHGHYSTQARFGITAHNDFLEVMFDYGMVGAILYVLLHVALVRSTLSMIRERFRYASAFALSYAIFFAMSMTSHLVIYPTYFVFLASFWGLIEGLRRSERAPGGAFSIQAVARPQLTR